jgi:hypothetical protein
MELRDQDGTLLMSVGKTGGPAFPHSYEVMPDRELHTYSGMTLRDWFAGQAMVGILANDSDPSPEQVPHIVASAYTLADAMLSQREKS